LQPNWLPILYEKWLEKKERLRLRLARELENLKNMEYDEVIYHQKYQEYMSSVYEGSKMEKATNNLNLMKNKSYNLEAAEQGFNLQTGMGMAAFLRVNINFRSKYGDANGTVSDEIISKILGMSQT
jgi:hypothetical protein